MKKNNGLFNPRGIFMRISLVFCLLSTSCITLSSAAVVKAQNGLDKKININLKESSFSALLKEIERKTGVSFIYTNKEIINTVISVNDEAKSARIILAPLLKKYNLMATENGLLVTLRKVEPKIIIEAKPGSIVGYVKDQANNQTLPYATIIVKGSNQKVVTDVNGYFVLSNVPEGKVELKITYLGFKALETTVNVVGGKTNNVDLKLTSESNDMKGITITGIRRGESVALNNMQNADNVKYVLSEEQIERFPDATVGEAMQRVPGIAMDYSYGLPRNIIIRGLDQSMGSVTLNGNRLPSTQTNSRDIDLNGILSSTVEAIEVNKTLTPDMEADGTSGSVNIVSKTPKVGSKQFQVKGSFGNNFLLGKQNFDGAFNYGERKDKLAYLIGVNFSNTNRGEDRVQKDYDTYEINGVDQLKLSN